MPLDAARSWLCQQAEVSGTIAELALFAGAARRDVVPEATPELVAAIERYYGMSKRDAAAGSTSSCGAGASSPRGPRTCCSKPPAATTWARRAPQRSRLALRRL